MAGFWDWLAQSTAPPEGETDAYKALSRGFYNAADKVVGEPQRQLQSNNPYPPGSEEAGYFDMMKANAGLNWGADTALNMAGTGGMAAFTPGMAGVLGAAGGKLKSTQLPSLRGLPVDDAIAIARDEPHLIKGGEGTEGLYVGGPRDILSKRGLNNQRDYFDQYVAQDPRGGDWYDRYRAAVNEVTGGNPVDNQWMTREHGQWSAGASPEAETSFALKENNSALAGMPVKAGRPASHEAFMQAIDQQDPTLLARGKKTGEYATRNNPDLNTVPNATGVNDFRHQINLGYTLPDGSLPGTGGQLRGSSHHAFMDYETALAVDRANQAQLGGRSDWTGEQIQAAPWVRQKALAIQSRKEGLPYEDAFNRANTTIGDFFDKHTAYATHEAVPGANTGHLPLFEGAPNDARAAYSADPRSSWAFAPGGRDAIYGDMRLPGTGVAMRVRPTTEMQGLYTPPGGATEVNPGWSANPLVAFDSGKVKTVAPADQALLNAGEATRGYIDAQNASAWHKNWAGGQPGLSNSLFVNMPRKATQDELMALQRAGAQHGLPDVADTGRGVTMTSFYPPPENLGPAIRKGGLLNKVKAAAPDATLVDRVKTDSNLIDYVPAWEKGAGSGAATTELLSHINKTPEIRAALNNNPMIPQKALGNLERDSEWASKMGATREDIQNARRIIGEGPGWVDRLEAGLKSGAFLPALAVGLFGAGAYQGRSQQ